jgi:hypothetical protein
MTFNDSIHQALDACRDVCADQDDGSLANAVVCLGHALSLVGDEQFRRATAKLPDCVRQPVTADDTEPMPF